MRRIFFLLCFLLFTTGAYLAFGAECPPPASHSAKGWVEAGHCWQRLQRWPEADSAFRKALQLDPDLADAAIGQARALMALGDAVAASVELEQFIASHPEALPALELLAQWQEVRWNDKKEAIRLLEQCVRLAPSDPTLWKRLGDLQFLMDQWEQARLSYQAALKLTPRDPRLEARLGRCLEFLNQYAEAEKNLLQAVALNGKSATPSAEVPFRFAEYLYRQGRYTDSLEAYGSALKLDAWLADAYMGRALAYLKLQQKERAAQDALAALRTGGERQDAHQLLLRLARENKDLAAIRRHTEKIDQLETAEQEKQSRDRRLRQLLREGKPLMAEEKYVEAVSRFEEVLKISPDSGEAYFALAVCYSQMGRTDEALVHLRQYLSRRPAEADGYTVLGLLLLARGQQLEARQALERALELDPAQDEARQALASLPALPPRP